MALYDYKGNDLTKKQINKENYLCPLLFHLSFR